MPTRFQAALGYRTRGQRVPTLRLLMPLKRDVGINGKNSLHFGNSGRRLFFGRCRVGIYAHAVSGCLGA